MPSRLVPRRAVLLTVSVAVASALALPTLNAQGAPPTVPRVDLRALVGDWYEIATTTSFWHRQCVSETRYRFSVVGTRGLRAASSCNTERGPKGQNGRLRAGPGGDGRLSIRFAPALFAWLPAAWADFWVLAMDDGAAGWLLIGDDRRHRLAVIARTISLDEASMARALAGARRAGYDVSRLRLTPHQAAARDWPIP